MNSRLPLAFLALLAAGPRQAEITDLLVTRQDNELLVSFQMVGAFDEATLARIDSGLPTGFTYHVKVERLRKWWLNPTVSRSTLQVVAMYNAITREYLVNYKLNGRLIDSRVVGSSDDLQRAMTIFHALQILEVEDVPGWLVLRVRARLGAKTILGIIPTTIHTDWVDSERFRLRAGDQPRPVIVPGETP